MKELRDEKDFKQLTFLLFALCMTEQKQIVLILSLNHKFKQILEAMKKFLIVIPLLIVCTTAISSSVNWIPYWIDTASKRRFQTL